MATDATPPPSPDSPAKRHRDRSVPREQWLRAVYPRQRCPYCGSFKFKIRKKLFEEDNDITRIAICQGQGCERKFYLDELASLEN